MAEFSREPRQVKNSASGDKVILSDLEIDLADLANNKTPGSEELKGDLLFLARQESSKDEQSKIYSLLKKHGITGDPKVVYKISKSIKAYRKANTAIGKPSIKKKDFQDPLSEKYSPRELQGFLHKALENTDILKTSYFIKKKIERPECKETPEVLRTYKEILEQNAQSLSQIADHFFILKSLGAKGISVNIERLFPPLKPENTAVYRAALQHICSELNKMLGKNQALDLVADSAEFVAAAYVKHFMGFFAAKNPFKKSDALTPKTGTVLSIEPDISLLPVIASKKNNVNLIVATNSIWDAHLIYCLSSSLKLSGIDIRNLHLNKIAAAPGINDLRAVHINISRTLIHNSTVQSMLTLASKLKKFSQFIIEYPSYGIEREKACDAEAVKLYRCLIEKLGFAFEMRLGKTKCMEVDSPVERLFLPSSIGEKDYLIFTKTNENKQQAELENLSYNLSILETLSSLNYPKGFDTFIKTCQMLDVSELFSFYKGMLNVFGFGGSLENSNLKKIKKLLKDEKFEELVAAMVSSAV